MTEEMDLWLRGIAPSYFPSVSTIEPIPANE
jgi:hypothetical protein